MFPLKYTFSLIVLVTRECELLREDCPKSGDISARHLLKARRRGE